MKASGEPFALPPADQRYERLSSVLHVLYLLFNEGYATSSGPDLARTDLSGEAIRLMRAVHTALPEDPEVAGAAGAHAAHRSSPPGSHESRW